MRRTLSIKNRDALTIVLKHWTRNERDGLKIYVDRENRRNPGKRMSAEAVYDGCIQSRRFTDRVVIDETVYMMKIETRSVTSLVSVNRFVWLVNVSY